MECTTAKITERTWSAPRPRTRRGHGVHHGQDHGEDMKCGGANMPMLTIRRANTQRPTSINGHPTAAAAREDMGSDTDEGPSSSSERRAVCETTTRGIMCHRKPVRRRDDPAERDLVPCGATIRGGTHRTDDQPSQDTTGTAELRPRTTADSEGQHFDVHGKKRDITCDSRMEL
jgi:hypothetical protein